MPEEAIIPVDEFPPQRDRAFGRIVVDMGFAPQAEVDRSIGLVISQAFSGRDIIPLPQIMVGKGIISEEDAQLALARLNEEAMEDGQLTPDDDFSDTSRALPPLDEDGNPITSGPSVVVPAADLPGDSASHRLKVPAGLSLPENSSSEVSAAYSDAELPDEMPAVIERSPEITEIPYLVEVPENTPEAEALPDSDTDSDSDFLEPVPVVETPDENEETRILQIQAGEETAEEETALETVESEETGELPLIPHIEHDLKTDAQSKTGTMPIILQGENPSQVPASAVTVGPGQEETQTFKPLGEDQPTNKEPISGYKLLSRLAVDKTGTVFKARQTAMDRLVALKVLPPSKTSDAQFVETFFKEARSAGQLNHPNLVRVHEVGRTGRYYFYSMELIQGRTLSELVVKNGHVHPSKALALTVDVLKAIEHMSSKNMHHGELCPDAITITKQKTVKVLLYGLGQARSANTRYLIGDRCHYVAPERIITHDCDVRADIYSAGAVLFYMLTGQHPFPGANPNDVLNQHVSAPIPDPREYIDGISSNTAGIVMKALAKKRTKRFGSPGEMISSIERILAAGTASRPKSVGQAERTAANSVRFKRHSARSKRRRRRR
jgi:Protein kinase domain